MPNPRRIVLMALLGAAAGPAQGQEAPRIGRDGYRLGVPSVMTPPRPPPAPPLSSFQAAYRRAGRPRLVIFFNRDLADAPSGGPVLRRQDATTREEVPLGAAAAPAQRSGVPADATRDETGGSPVPQGAPGRRIETRRTTEFSVQRPTAGARRAILDEAGQWGFESAFNSPLTADGVYLVDRSTAIRLAALAHGDDPQRLEVAAIRSYAEMAVVVRATASSEGAVLFRITTIDTRNGRILTDEMLPASNGPITSEAAAEAGRSAALHLIDRLTQSWTPAP
jgi:hypothetical protein